jgi:hypothetical protein
MAEVSDGSTGFSQPGVDLPGDAEPVMQPPIPHLLPYTRSAAAEPMAGRGRLTGPLLGIKS